MKKSLIALAALATVATAAQAQSSATVYGVMDTGVAHLNRANGAETSWTGAANGGLATSRIGFTGTEDLGGGLKANFKLEAQLFPTNGIAGSNSKATVDNSQSGTVNSSSFFNRESTVGLSGAFGAVKLGRANTVAYDKSIALDPMGYGNFGSVGSFSPAFIARVDKQVKYASPVFNGVQVDLAYSSLGNPGADGSGTTQEAAATYKNGGLTLIAAYAATKTTLQGSYNADYAKQYGVGLTNGNDGYENTQLGLVYETGAYTVKAGYSTKKDKSATAALGTNAKDLWYAGVGYAVTPASRITVAYYDYNNKTAANAKSHMTSAQFKYSLSKRTDLYAIAAIMNNDSGAALTVADNANVYVGASNTGATPATGKDQSGYMVGIRHTF